MRGRGVAAGRGAASRGKAAGCRSEALFPFDRVSRIAAGPSALSRFRLLTFSLLAFAGCARVPNQFREDGPSAYMAWDSPTAADVKARFQPVEPRYRPWEAMTVAADSGAVSHGPLYFEDPFEDKGHGRTDETHPHDVHRMGWEDPLAFLYGYSRFTANWLLLPISAIVTPPWTEMESDGVISRQILGYDHDARRVDRREPQAPPAAQSETEGSPTREVRQPADAGARAGATQPAPAGGSGTGSPGS